MSKETIWTCDRCKRKWSSVEGHADPLREVRISAGQYTIPIHSDWRVYWCNDCLVNTGVYKPKTSPDKKPDEPEHFSMEDMVREIVREEMDLQQKGITMLVLSRKRNQSIVINDDITITIVEIRGDKVRLGVEAPKEVPVHRAEVFEAIKRGDAA